MREVFKVLLQEASTSSLQSIPRGFYEEALKYVESLKLKANGDANDLQRKIRKGEAAIIEGCLQIVRNIRIRKAVMRLLGGCVDLKDLPREEEVQFMKVAEALEIKSREVGGEGERDEGRILLLIRGSAGDLVKGLGLPNLEVEDVIFINMRKAKELINLGIAEPIRSR
ncbi:MAG: hypothetical protein QFX33_03745 [Candidatus Nezhaarchaeota archaeon]|nr:hypothetical protein [Candidatus Nezhaarchaeota archaeon]